jgi:hypothetical protein
LIQMFQSLQILQQNAMQLTKTVGALFSMINLWNDSSSVEQSDFITPTSGNTLERISIAVQHAYIPFTLTANSTSTVPTAIAPVTPTITTAASTSTPAHSVKTILIEVHRRANFNIIGGLMVMRVPTSTYAVQAGLTPATIVNSNPTPVKTQPNPAAPANYAYTFVFDGICNNTTGIAGMSVVNVSGTAGSTTPPPTPAVPSTPAYTCVVQTQTGKTQLAGMAGIDWFPFGRDYFPRRNGFSIYKHDLIPAAFAATSVTSLGNVAFGLNFEPISGIDFLVGAGMAHTAVLPNGVTPSTVLPGGYTLPGVTQVNWGVTYGVGFDLSVFTQIFSKGPSSATLP